MAAGRSPYDSSRRRARTALVLGTAGILTMPAAVALADQSRRVTLLEAGWAVPLALLLGALAAGMGHRAKRNLDWLRLDGRGSAVARVARTLGVLALSLALMAGLSIVFYEAVLYYQRHR
jgi:peptidoglycan/LPS O-acetylase OafA/YrhL